MNETIVTILIVFSAIVFGVGLFVYNVRSVQNQNTAIDGVRTTIKSFRYMLEFFSFVSTMIILIIFGSSFIDGNNINGWESTSLYFILVVFSVWLSFLISKGIISTESAIGHGSKKEIAYILYVTYVMYAFANYSSMSFGGAGILNNITSTKITEVSTTNDISFIMKSKEKLVNSLNAQLLANENKLSNIENLKLTPNKRILYLQGEVDRYTKNGKRCPNTRKALASEIDKQKNIYMKQLRRENNSLIEKIDKITSSYENTSIRANGYKDKQTEQIKEANSSNKHTMSMIAFLSIVAGFILSVIDARLGKDEEEIEEVVEVDEEQKDGDMTIEQKIKVIQAAVRVHARGKETRIMDSDISSQDFKLAGYSRNAISILARDIRSGGKVFSWSDRKIFTSLSDYIKADGDFRKWLAGQEWNNKGKLKSRYYKTQLAQQYDWETQQ